MNPGNLSFYSSTETLTDFEADAPAALKQAMPKRLLP